MALRLVTELQFEKPQNIMLTLLAAGGGSRWKAAGGDGHKLLAILPDGRALVRAAVDAALAADVGEVIVVRGAIDVEPFMPDDIEVTVVDNPNWALGQATSLQVAIDIAQMNDVDAIVVGLGDQPWVSPQAWRVVVERLKTPGRPIVMPLMDGVRGQPVGIRSSVWDKLPKSGDEGARILVRQTPELVDEVVCPVGKHTLADVDLPGDLPWS